MARNMSIFEARLIKCQRDLTSAINGYIEVMLDIHMGYHPSAREMIAKHGLSVDRQEAASLLNVSPKTITAMVRDGRLRGTSTGVLTESIAKYIDEGRPTAQYYSKYGWPSERAAAKL